MVWEVSKGGKTRHAIRMSWNGFVKSGGSLGAIQRVSRQHLDAYQVGRSIWRYKHSL